MKEETVIEQILQGVARQEGAKQEKPKIVKANQVAGIHVFSSDMEKPPTVLIDGDASDVVTILAYATNQLVDEIAKQGINRVEAEETIIEAIQYMFKPAQIEAISLTPEAAATGQGVIYPAEEADRMIAEGKAVETKPFNGTEQHTIEKANQKGEQDNGKNESEI